MISLPDQRDSYKPLPVRPGGFRAYLPATLDLSAITRPAWVQYAAWAVSAVVRRRFFDRAVTPSDFVPLGSVYVRRHLPDRVWLPLVADLKRHGVLECDGLYYFDPTTPGKRGKCLCFRLGDRYRGEPVRAVTLTHPELIRKMNAAQRAERAAVAVPTHVALRAWHDRVELLPAAPRGEHPALDALLDGERRFTVCAQGRVHHNVSNLPREYRPYLRLAGGGLDSVDIATCQPLLTALLLTGRAGMPEEHTRARGRGGRARGVPVAPSSEPGLTDYLAHCLDGTLYDRLAAATGFAREEVKPRYFAVVYGDPRHADTKVGVALARLYPAVYAAVTDLNFALGHGSLPRRMQEVESGVMIGRVAGRLTREHPGVPLLTVHDAVVVPPPHADLAERLIREEWRAAFGVVPRTKRTEFTASHDPRFHRPV